MPVRKYTREHCEQRMGGVWHANGECTRASGGSYSYSCSYLNAKEPWPMIMREFETLFDLSEPNTLRWVLVGTAAAGGGYAYYRMRRK